MSIGFMGPMVLPRPREDEGWIPGIPIANKIT